MADKRANSGQTTEKGSLSEMNRGSPRKSPTRGPSNRKSRSPESTRRALASTGTASSSQQTLTHRSNMTSPDPKAAKAKPVKPLIERKCVFCPLVESLSNACTPVIDTSFDKSIARTHLVVQPIGPVCDGHILVFPRKHVQDATADPVIFGQTCEIAARVARHVYRGMDVNITTNQGLLAEQSVPHLHIHIVPRRKEDGLIFPWTTQMPGHFNTTGQREHPEYMKPHFKSDEEKEVILKQEREARRVEKNRN